MLRFCRKQFVDGVIIIKQKVPRDVKVGKLLKRRKTVDFIDSYIFRPKDLGKTFEFFDEADILKRYPLCFEKVDPQASEKKVEK